jgi:hypothetical protein
MLVVSFAVSTGTSYYYLKDIFSFDSAFIADIEARQDDARQRQQKKKKSRLYGAADKKETAIEDGIVLRRDTVLVVAEDVIRKYLKPYKVRLLDLYMDKEGIIYIDLGGELKRNFSIDALEEVKIIADLYKGLKATIPGFRALRFLIEGKEAESLAGHIDIRKPIGEEIATSI